MSSSSNLQFNACNSVRDKIEIKKQNIRQITEWFTNRRTKHRNALSMAPCQWCPVKGVLLKACCQKRPVNVSEQKVITVETLSLLESNRSSVTEPVKACLQTFAFDKPMAHRHKEDALLVWNNDGRLKRAIRSSDRRHNGGSIEWANWYTAVYYTESITERVLQREYYTVRYTGTQVEESGKKVNKEKKISSAHFLTSRRELEWITHKESRDRKETR